jgi:hypothetical protein
MRRKFVLILLPLLLIAATSEGGCGEAHRDDLDESHITVTDPDSVTVYRNANGHPNIGVVCIEGIAFITTTNGGSYQGGVSGRSGNASDLNVSQILCGEEGDR